MKRILYNFTIFVSLPIIPCTVLTSSQCFYPSQKVFKRKCLKGLNFIIKHVPKNLNKLINCVNSVEIIFNKDSNVYMCVSKNQITVLGSWKLVLPLSKNGFNTDYIYF